MRITKNQLRQIIKEELEAVLSEDKPAKGSPEHLALTGVNVAGRAARKVKRAFAGSGEEERSAEEQPEGPPLPSRKTVPGGAIELDLDGRAIADKVARHSV
jgi:hypothetical protein